MGTQGLQDNFSFLLDLLETHTHPSMGEEVQGGEVASPLPIACLLEVDYVSGEFSSLHLSCP